MGVTGIGGIFFRARDPQALAAWYRDTLGLGTSPYGEWQTAAGPTVFAPFPQDSDHIPAGRQWMLNLRVDDLPALLARLRVAGAEVIEKPEWNDPMTGQFARVHDPEGNPVELWQPPVE